MTSIDADGRLKRETFTHLELPSEAVDFLLVLWDLTQGMDDWVDGTEGDPFLTLWAVFVGLPGSSFLHAHGPLLVPVMANALLKWHAANVIEAGKETQHLPKAYMWRACYYDVVLQVVLIVHGIRAKEFAAVVMRLYYETLDDYLKEMANVRSSPDHRG